LAMGGVLMFTIFVLVGHHLHRKERQNKLLLTITGNLNVAFEGDKENLTTLVGNVVGPFTVQRFEVDNDKVQFRAIVSPESQNEIGVIMNQLQSKLPACRISYVNLENLL